jgi:hypothetical protein
VNQANSKALKLTIIIIISFLLFLALTSALVFYFFPKEKVKSIIIESARDLLKREITIESLDYSLKGFSLTGIIIYETTSQDGKILAEADNIVLGVSLPSLIQKQIEVSRIYSKNLKINFEFDDEGNSNIGKLFDDLSGTPGEEKQTAEIKMIRMENTSFTLKNPPEILKPLEGEYSINSDFYPQKNSTIVVKKCRLKLPGQRGILYPDVTVKIKKDDFEITGESGLDKASLTWVYRWSRSPLPYHLVTGRITELKITKDLVEGKANAEATIYNSHKKISAEGYCRVRIDKETVLIYNTRGTIDKSKGFLKKLLLTFRGNPLGLELPEFDFNISDIRSLITEVPDKLYGRASGNISYSEETINAGIKLVNTGFDFKNKLVSGINTEVKISNNIFKNENLQIKIMGNPCLVSIASTDGLLDKVFLNISAEDFTVKMNNNGSKQASVNLPFQLTGKISAKKVFADPVTITGMNIIYTAAGKKIDIRKLGAYTMGGSINGSGQIDLAEKVPRATLNTLFNSIKVQDLASLSDSFKGRMYGVADGRLNLSCELGKNILKTVKGKAEVIIDKGKLANTGIQNGLGIWLSELKYKLKDLEFNKIYGNVSLNGVNYYINSFQLQSEDIQLKLRGKIDENFIAENLLINLEFTNQFIQDLPAPAIRIGLRKNLRGKWYIIPFVLNGDITNSKNLKRIR